uniref:CST complex subunit STN1 n=1 Tax=Neogobius melanostomus TaxID=47308 RepID=A0A8C6SXR9_9GOBI
MGLDPVFSAFARLYIRDILQMTESTQVPGIYFYNSHPIYKVDVLGTVVYKRERDDFFCYGVDDSTGVINCLCWKMMQTPMFPLPRVYLCDPHAVHLSFANCCSNVFLCEIVRQLHLLYITHVCRCLCVFPDKVDDPVMAVQIAWMMELPELYRQCYDKPLQLQSNTTSSFFHISKGKATNIIRDFLNQKSVVKFRPYDVQDLLLPLVNSQPQVTAEDQEHVAGPSGCQKLRQLLKEVLQTLQDEGFLYRKVKSQDEVYTVTGQDKELVIAVKDVIREDSKREKYAEKGCHVLHILSAVRQRYSLNLSKAALELVLKSLECNSDIISSSDSHYTML